MTDTPASRLSGPAAVLVAHGMRGVAVRLIIEWGGTNRYIPSHPSPSSPLVGVVGMEAALVLAREYGNTQVDIPSRSTLEDTLKADILRLGSDGDSSRVIAQKLGCTERYARSVLRRGDVQPCSRRQQKDERQMDLIEYLQSS